MSLQDKIVTLHNVLNTVLKVIEVVANVINAILEKIEKVGE